MTHEKVLSGLSDVDTSGVTAKLAGQADMTEKKGR